MANIKASVGIRNGKPCYNVPADQQIVQKLLDRISVGNGGCESDGDTDWTPAKWGQCAPDLYDAICRFQKVNRFRLDYSSDGHVDPGGGSIQLMTQLSQGGVNGLPGGAGGKLGDPDDQPNVTMDLRPMFASGLVQTNWVLESSSSLSASVAVLGGGVGRFHLTHNSRKYTLTYMMGGAVLSPIPVSVSGSPSSFRSTRCPLYTYGSRPDLDISDLTGPLLVLTGAIGGVPVPGTAWSGSYLSLIYFNTTLGPGMAARILAQLSSTAAGMGLSQLNRSTGAVTGIWGADVSSPDLSLSLTSGLAWTEGPQGTE